MQSQSLGSLTSNNATNETEMSDIPFNDPDDRIDLSVPLMTAREVAELLRIPEKTVLNMARDGRLPSLKLGRRRVFARAQIARAIERRRGEL